MEKCVQIEAGGVRFRARQRGATADAVFLHGFGADLHTWDHLWRELGDEFAALRCDLRGFGESEPARDDAFSHADDLQHLLDALELGSVAWDDWTR